MKKRQILLINRWMPSASRVINITIPNKMERNKIIESSTHTRAKKRMMYDWLVSTDNLKIFPRITTGITTDRISSKLRFDNSSHNEFKDLIHLGSYNYAGLNGHPEVINAAMIALKKYGTTTSGVRLLNGTYDIHIEFEEKLANFLGTEDAVTFSSGLAANIAAMTTLCSEDDIVFSDELNHQSIVDGLKMSKTKVVKFLHSNIKQLENLLKQQPLNKRKFIVTDGVFSMDGDICELDKIVELGHEYNAFVIVDDAHSIAAIGANGRGTASHFKISPPDVITGSLSKGLPGIGGYLAGSKELMDLFRYGSNPYIFSASIPAPIIAGLMKAIELLEENPTIINILHENEIAIRNGLSNIGLNTMQSNSPIIPILIGDRKLTFKFAELLHNEGIYVNPVLFPAVSLNKARLRINASAALSNEQIDYSLNKIELVAKELQII